MHKMMNCSIIGSEPIYLIAVQLMLFDLDYVTPSKWNLWWFWSILLRMFRFEYIVTTFPYLIATEWILCIISTACLSLPWIETTRNLCYSCNIYVVFNDIDYSYVMAYHILYTILFNCGCVDYDYIVSHMVWFTA